MLALSDEHAAQVKREAQTGARFIQINDHTHLYTHQTGWLELSILPVYAGDVRFLVMQFTDRVFIHHTPSDL